MKLTPPDPNHPALAAAPKSLREALERLLAWAENGKPTAVHKYRDGKGNLCAIGQFFTEEQLSEIAPKRTLNTGDVIKLVKKFGEPNIMVMTGMNLEQANAIQMTNDRGGGKDEIARIVRRILHTGKGEVRYVEFDLTKEK